MKTKKTLVNNKTYTIPELLVPYNRCFPNKHLCIFSFFFNDIPKNFTFIKITFCLFVYFKGYGKRTHLFITG